MLQLHGIEALILIDDPSKPEEALSDARRNATNEGYLNTLTAGSTTNAVAASSSSCSELQSMVLTKLVAAYLARRLSLGDPEPT